LIVPIGNWVSRVACTQIKQWHSEGFDSLGISVNLCARQFQEKDLVSSVVEILSQSRLDPKFLELEITESSIMTDADFAVKVLTELKALGIRVSVDDFGTGFSSLGYLKRLPVDILKIDQSFVRDVSTDPDAAALVMTIISLAHNLRLKVIAEGVETEEQLRFLRLLRCDEIQGYLFSKPLPAEEFRALLIKAQTGNFERSQLVPAA
jgi:EAL domain-containing protein (putative c-di-GMP-specific phosphodiesterase class I)